MHRRPTHKHPTHKHPTHKHPTHKHPTHNHPTHNHPTHTELLNVFMFLRCGVGRVFLEQENEGDDKGKWGLPGGGLKLGEQPFKGAKREFKEETGHNLPDITPVKHHDFKRARTYFGQTDYRFSSFQSNNNEIMDWKFMKISDLIEFGKDGFRIVTDTDKFTLRSSFRKSLIHMIKNNENFCSFIEPYVSRRK